MSLSNSPDPAVREAIVRQDLDNVLHPIVQHKMGLAQRTRELRAISLPALECNF